MPDRFRRAILGSATALSLALPAALGAQQPQGAPIPAPTRAAIAEQLDSIAAAYVREAPAAGVTVAVVRKGDTLLLKGYGERDRDQHLAAEASTVYRIGSITKQFTAAAVLRQIQKGTIKLMRWQSALHAGRVVTPKNLALMVGPETLTAGEKKGSKIDYGMGLVSMSAGGRPLIQHGGDINGFASQQYWFPADSLSVVAFVNTSGANQDWLAKNLAAAVLGLPVTPLRPPVLPLAAADREKYVGDYDLSLPDGRILPIRMYVENDQLVAEPEGQPKQVMRFFGSDTFGMDFDPTLRVMFTVEGGAVKGGKVQQRGATMNLTRRQ